MANVVVQSGGVQGPRGSGWLSGTGAPVANGAGQQDGDLYFDTTNVGFYYGPRSGGVWGAPKPFGNSLNGVPLVNIVATTNPTVSNDTTQGYSKGSYWINTTTNTYFVCTNASTGAAVWNQAVNVGSAAGGDLSGTYPNPTVAKINTTSVTGTPPGSGYFLVSTGSNSSSWNVGPSVTSGITGGAVMTQASSTSFSITQGIGQIANYTSNPLVPTVSKVAIAPQTITLSGAQLAQNITWWVSDVNGNITSQNTQPTPDQRRTSIQLGAVLCTSNVITQVISAPIYTPQVSNQLEDLIYALGPFVESGNQIQANGANLSFNKLAGTMFSASAGYAADANNLHSVANPAETPTHFFYATQLSNSFTPATALDPTTYDVNGTKTTVPNPGAQATIQRVFLAATGQAGSQIAVQYGQTVYSNLAAAQAGVGAGTFVRDPDITASTLVAWICITKQCTSLLDTSNCSIIMANKFATP